MSRVFTHDLEELTQFANDIKDSLSEQAGCKELDKYAVVLAKHSMLGKIFRNLMGMKEDEKGLYILVMEKAKLAKGK